MYAIVLRKFNSPQVALIVFLAHIGSFVPADAATVGLTDRFGFPIYYQHLSHIPCYTHMPLMTTTAASISFLQNILRNGKQVHDCRTINIHD